MRTLLLAGLLAAAPAFAPGDRVEVQERELFDAAARVFMGKVIHHGDLEHAPGTLPGRPYTYQVLWVEDAEVFKGPEQPPKYGYTVVMVPIRTQWNSPDYFFPEPFDVTTLRKGEPFLFYLTRDKHGAWVILDGPGGLWRNPGRTRLENLRKWGRETRKKG